MKVILSWQTLNILQIAFVDQVIEIITVLCDKWSKVIAMNDGGDYAVIKEQHMNWLLNNGILNHWYKVFYACTLHGTETCRRGTFQQSFQDNSINTRGLFDRL